MKEGKGKIIQKPIIIIIAVLVLISIALTSTSLARYITNRNKNENALVAAFEVTPGATFTTPLNVENFYPGQKSTWSFTVTSGSEVATKCKAVIESTGNLPLTYVFKCDSVVVSKDLICTFEPNDNTVHTIAVIIQWLDTPENKSDYYNGKIDIVRFTLVAEQIG